MGVAAKLGENNWKIYGKVGKRKSSSCLGINEKAAHSSTSFLSSSAIMQNNIFDPKCFMLLAHNEVNLVFLVCSSLLYIFD